MTRFSAAPRLPLLSVVVPASGRSERLPGADGCPKQLRRFAWRGAQLTMMEHAVRSLVSPGVDVHFAIRVEHRQFLTTELADSPYVHHTWDSRGQAETVLGVLRASWQSVGRGPVLVLNCDAGWEPWTLPHLVACGRSTGTAPSCAVFRAPPEEASRWSYVDGCPVFHRAAEKVAIGTHALAGAYYFPDAYALRRELELMMPPRHVQFSHEPQMSEVLAQMPGAKHAHEIPRAEWYDWGTATALEAFLRGQPEAFS